MDWEHIVEIGLPCYDVMAMFISLLGCLLLQTSEANEPYVVTALGNSCFMTRKQIKEKRLFLFAQSTYTK